MLPSRNATTATGKPLRMIKIWFQLFALVLGVATAHSSCETPATGNCPASVDLQKHGRSLEVSSVDIASAVNTLGFNIIRQLRQVNPGANVVFSPLSISAAISLAYYGARGSTRSQIGRVFGFQDNDVPELLKKKAEDFGEGTSRIATIANRAYPDAGFPIIEEYTFNVGQDNVFAIDFDMHEHARAKINGWVESVTRGLIKDLIPSGSIDDLTRLILVNAIYFKGTWKSSFPRGETGPAEFRGTSGLTTAEFMIQREKYFNTKFLPDLQHKVLELPYVGDRFSMFIVLPNADDGYLQLENNLAEYRTRMFTGLYPELFTKIQIPKWSLEQTLGDLKLILENLGMTAAFTDEADFSGITSAEELYISDVVHKAKITVDEEGTEAAAATAATITSKSASVRGDNLFIADHPFVYFIVDKTDNSVFFQGTFASP